MIVRSHELSLKRQAQLLKLSRSGIYYSPRPVSLTDLAIMRVSTRCIWNTRLRAAGCCVIC